LEVYTLQTNYIIHSEIETLRSTAIEHKSLSRILHKSNDLGSTFRSEPRAKHPSSETMRLVRDKEYHLNTDETSGNEDITMTESPGQIDHNRNRFPFSVVFQPLPPLTWLIPLIGHMGICDSQGRVHDFQGPYTIGVDCMMLGKATRYIPLDPHKVQTKLLEGETVEQRWDRCVREGDLDFRRKMHMLICQNCNHHTAKCLSLMEYGGVKHFGCLTMWVWVFMAGRFVGTRGFLYTMLPSILLIIGIILSCVL